MKINTNNSNIDYYCPTLERVTKEILVTGFIINPNSITFNLEEAQGAGLSFVTEYINIDKVLESYCKIGTKQEKEVKEIKNNKYYPYIEENYIFTISRDNDYTDKTSVSCEYWDTKGKTWTDTSYTKVAERISIIINIIKDYICDYMLQEVRKTDEEIPYIMEDITLKIVGKPHYIRENTNGISIFKAKAMDKKGNLYIVTWLAYEDWDKDNDDEKNACNWNEPFYIQLIEKAEED